MTETAASSAIAFKLQRPIDPASDHLRGGLPGKDVVTVVFYGDFLCPYCRRLRPIMIRLRQALGQSMAFVFRHFFNETNHPGATFMARAAEAEKLIDRAASPDLAATLALAEKLARVTDGVERFGAFFAQVLAERIRARAMAGGARLDRWTALLEKLKGSFTRTDALHMEPRQTILSAERALTATARGRAL